MRPHEDLRLALWVWGLLAAVCLICGYHFADNPTGSEAYFTVREWLAAWRMGANVYALRLFADYPPNALVFLSPLSLFPQTSGHMLFAAINVVVCMACSWMLVGLTAGYAGVSLDRVQRLVYALMLLVMSPSRVAVWNGQTSPLLILFCCQALRIAPRWPILAGVLMGVGMSKPHVAFGFMLVGAFNRMWLMLASAFATAITAWWGYSISVGQSPVTVFFDYVSTLLGLYGGPQFLRAEADIRPFFVDVFRTYAVGEPLFLVTALVLAAVLLWFTWRGRHRPEAGVWVMAAALMWCIAVFPFRRYGLMLMAPTMMLTLWRPGLSERALTGVAIMILVLVADVPFLIRHTVLRLAPDWSRYALDTHYVNRALTGICLVIAFASLARVTRRRVA